MILPPHFILVDKPIGWTSFDVVGYIRSKVRHRNVILSEAKDLSDTNLDSSCHPAGTQNDSRRLKPKNIKVGHAGTLDPFATGLLIVGVGREATKRLDEFKGLPKTYVATIRLGATSDTGDSTGTIVKKDIGDKAIGDKLEIAAVLKTFLGKQQQIPPMYSAKSVGGQRLYKLARQGIDIERQPNEIEIYDLKLVRYEWPVLEIEVTCSAGTYIRTLSEDIGKKLGVGAYCETLRRTRIGAHAVEEAQKIDALDLTDVMENYTV